MRLSYLFATADCRSKKVLGLRGDLDQSCAQLVAFGYDGVELMVRNPRELDQAGIARTIAQHGLSVPDIGAAPLFGEDKLALTDPDPTVRQRVRGRLRDVIDFSARFGAQVHVGRFRGYLPEDGEARQALDWLTDSLLEAADYGRSRGVRVLLEPLCHFEANIFLTVLETVEFLRSLSHPNLGVLADTFHMNIEERCLPASLMAAKDYLTHVHFADSNRRYMGAGHINFTLVLEALRLIGYDRFITIEVKQEPDPETAARLAAKTVRALLDTL
ncbi:MAG TPA: sugar phosphate isomerase/epimerase family protein [Candidatus Methylomirabilis sp.]|nr:sugar phosphate isomerase/epimerase family protein [Candidatus Methylomirabilis sp.]